MQNVQNVHSREDAMELCRVLLGVLTVIPGCCHALLALGADRLGPGHPRCETMRETLPPKGLQVRLVGRSVAGAPVSA